MDFICSLSINLVSYAGRKKEKYGKFLIRMQAAVNVS